MNNTMIDVTPHYNDIPNRSNDYFVKVDEQNDNSIDEEFKRYLSNSPSSSMYSTPFTQT